MFELITHEVPWMTLEPLQSAAAVALSNERPLLPEGTPPGLAKILHDAWQTQRSDRPAASELIDLLEQLNQRLTAKERAWLDSPFGHKVMEDSSLATRVTSALATGKRSSRLPSLPAQATQGETRKSRSLWDRLRGRRRQNGS